MDDAVRVVSEMNQWVWDRLKGAVDDLNDEEIDWRPLPEGNSINIIVRHLRIEAQWHLELEELYATFLDVLRAATLDTLRTRTATAYGSAAANPGAAHLLGYHQAVHVAMHCGQIRTIRNLYRKSRGEPARFFPENPTYPR